MGNKRFLVFIAQPVRNFTFYGLIETVSVKQQCCIRRELNCLLVHGQFCRKFALFCSFCTLLFWCLSRTLPILLFWNNRCFSLGTVGQWEKLAPKLFASVIELWIGVNTAILIEIWFSYIELLVKVFSYKNLIWAPEITSEVTRRSVWMSFYSWAV